MTPAVKVTPAARRYNYNFRANINWLGETNGYLGQVTVDVQAARTAVNRPECSLNLQTPCIAPDGALTATMPPVTALNFSVIDFTSFYQNYVGFPPTNAVRPPATEAIKQLWDQANLHEDDISERGTGSTICSSMISM